MWRSERLEGKGGSRFPQPAEAGFSCVVRHGWKPCPDVKREAKGNQDGGVNPLLQRGLERRGFGDSDRKSPPFAEKKNAKGRLPSSSFVESKSNPRRARHVVPVPFF
jgi:hypothetical protein